MSLPDKDKLRTESPQKFLGCVAFLCQCFARMRDGYGKPLETLSVPVAEAIEMCLDKDATDEEMQCAAVQVQV